MKMGWVKIGRILSLFSFVFAHPAWSAGTADSHDDHAPTGSSSSRRPEEQKQNGEAAACSVSPQQLADFANGENYNFHSMVTYLTQPECLEAAPQIGRAAYGVGVKFTSSGPYKLQDYAGVTSGADFEGKRRLDETLGKAVPGWLRESPLSATEILPVIGQLAILSPQGARASLTNLIETQLYGADPGVLDSKSPSYVAKATGIAQMLSKLGANEPLIAASLADSVEEMAVLAEADSLGKIFRGLAVAATVDITLAPTFHLSADALNRGVQKGDKFYTSENRNNLLLAVFRGVQASVSGSEPLEAGAGELNEALGTLMNGKPLKLTNLKKLYREALRIVAEVPSQPALADAMALSLTPDFIFLPPKEIALLLKASTIYPQLAKSIQMNFLEAYALQWHRLQDGQITVTQFNRTKTKTFEPVLDELLELGPGVLGPEWLKAVLQRGLITDEQIEKKFPRFLLVYLEQQEKSTKGLFQNITMENMLISANENFRILWTLSNVHVPALMKWVRRYDQ